MSKNTWQDVPTGITSDEDAEPDCLDSRKLRKERVNKHVANGRIQEWYFANRPKFDYCNASFIHNTITYELFHQCSGMFFIKVRTGKGTEWGIHRQPTGSSFN